MRQLTLVETDTVEWLDVPEPVIQNPQEALVRPIAVARCDLDYPIIRGRAPFKPPIALGHEFVADVVEVGDGVSAFAKGDRVIVPFQISCGDCERCQRGLTNSCSAVPPGSNYGFGGEYGGALADLVRVPFAEGMLLPLPDGMDPAAIASADNLPDGWRTVGPYLGRAPDSRVLVVAGGAPSIALYAAAIACALGAPVDYVDRNEGRRELAASVGANPMDWPPPEPSERYPISVDASADSEGLTYALKATATAGVCTSIGIYFQETALPLWEMYQHDVTFVTGRVNARAALPHVIDLIDRHGLRPQKLTTLTVPWDDAKDAWLERTTKVVAMRSA